MEVPWRTPDKTRVSIGGHRCVRLRLARGLLEIAVPSCDAAPIDVRLEPGRPDG